MHNRKEKNHYDNQKYKWSMNTRHTAFCYIELLCLFLIQKLGLIVFSHTHLLNMIVVTAEPSCEFFNQIFHVFLF